MAKENVKSKRGFTIIEVVLVLAIAGLIFLMVFVALPALQRSQRDTQRRNDLARVVTAIQNFQTNNNHKIPTSTEINETFRANYLTANGDTFTDPAGTDYYFYNASTGANKGIGACGVKDGECEVQAGTEFRSGRIVAVSNATCDGEKAVYAHGQGRIALLIKLEGAGTYCVHN